MSKEKERKSLSSIRLDVYCAFDADLNKIWEKGGKSFSPREKLTLKEVLEAQKRESESDNILSSLN